MHARPRILAALLTTLAALAVPAAALAIGQASVGAVRCPGPGGTRRGTEIRSATSRVRGHAPPASAPERRGNLGDVDGNPPAPGAIAGRRGPDDLRPRHAGSRITAVRDEHVSPLRRRTRIAALGGPLDAHPAVFHDAHAPPSRSSRPTQLPS